MKASNLAILLALTLSGAAQAAQYVVKLKDDGSTGIRFSVPYSAGVHKGFSKEVTGAIEINDKDQLQSAKFSVPILSMTTKNETRDCHMVEALGIDYTASRFPGEHVCDENNKLPASGPDSMAFPNVEFEFQSFDSAPITPFKEGEDVVVMVNASLKLHGRTMNYTQLPLTVQKTKVNGKTFYQVKTQFRVSLNDFAVVVKPFKIGFIKIGVDDKVTLDLDLTLGAKN